MDFSKILKSLIVKEDLTVSLLSRKLDIPVQTIHNWLSGAEPRNIRQVKQVADYFSVSLDEIFFGDTGKVKIPPSFKQKSFSLSFNELKELIRLGKYEVVLRKIEND